MSKLIHKMSNSISARRPQCFGGQPGMAGPTDGKQVQLGYPSSAHRPFVLFACVVPSYGSQKLHSLSAACLCGGTVRKDSYAAVHAWSSSGRVYRIPAAHATGKVSQAEAQSSKEQLLSMQEVSSAADAQLMQQGERIKKKMTAPKTFPRVAMDLATTVERIQQNFCICDPNLPDNPIVFASDGFLEMSQFDRFEVLGRNCRFLQVQPFFRLLHASGSPRECLKLDICNENSIATTIQCPSNGHLSLLSLHQPNGWYFSAVLRAALLVKNVLCTCRAQIQTRRR
jgi:hypothetical protein